MAQLRICNAALVSATVAKRGDPDAGAILIKIFRHREDCRVFSQATNFDGARGWICATGDVPVSELAADTYIERQKARDRDLWVIEIEDPKGSYVLADIVDTRG